MKLRIRGNTLRLRLTRAEVARLGETGRVTDAIVFGAGPGEALTYAVETSAAVAEVGATFSGGHITVLLPERLARTWLDTEQVGISAEPTTGADAGAAGRLEILVEKDFACLDRRDDDADAFPHPRAGSTEC